MTKEQTINETINRHTSGGKADIDLQILEVLEELKCELDAAPKSKAGFVNWKRSSRSQREAVEKLLNIGIEREEARSMALKVAAAYDTHYSKIM